VFAEPAAAAAWAGTKQARTLGLIDSSERVVVISTGSGLKDVAAAMSLAGKARIIGKNGAELRELLG
jgi:threonine synthase